MGKQKQYGHGLLIGLSGYAEHGKSTVAQILVDSYGFVRMAFADELKAMIHRIDPIICVASGVRLSQVWETLGQDEGALKKQYPEYRRYMQSLGTEGVRHVDDAFWVRALEEKVKRHWQVHPGTRIVVDDVRFPNEANSILNNPESGEMWRIDRPGHPNPQTGHESEQWVGRLGEYRTITNTGSREELIDTLGKLVDY